jgi:hypothetical protein
MPSALEVSLQQLISSLNVAEEPTFQTILQLLYESKYSGAITLHCYNGQVKIAEMGKPIRIDLSRKS